MNQIISINSAYSTKHTSSCDFTYTLPIELKSITNMFIIGGNIPYTTENYLFYNIGEMMTKNTYLHDGRYVNGILRWDTPIVTNKDIIIKDPYNYCNKNKIQLLRELNVKLYNSDGDIHSFGNDYLSIHSMTLGTIRTTVNHGLLANDIVYISGVDNMHNESLNKQMNKMHVVSNIVSAIEFDISDVDMSSELVYQALTGEGVLYTFGQNAIVNFMTVGHSLAVKSIKSHASGTEIETYNKHDITSGTRVVITGMDNGLLSSDNDKINSSFYITNITSDYKFVIPSILSGYPLTSYKTNSSNTYLLGSHGKIKIKKYQVTLDFHVTTGHGGEFNVNKKIY
jgi:hypothetical protein